ncbi:unnamed protein product [Penicillium roqueforti FM164]|uniref:Genomic scaffold, ProqFM164S03 n=1 Tax=Penicillium roqueforti (strain FM164) TaxID=1365484 RepID=W6QYG5_PENRF|nr:unnamed protein product [Penicillium roqueforti FM164]
MFDRTICCSFLLLALSTAMVIREEGVESLVAKLVRLAEEKRRVIE